MLFKVSCPYSCRNKPVGIGSFPSTQTSLQILLSTLVPCAGVLSVYFDFPFAWYSKVRRGGRARHHRNDGSIDLTHCCRGLDRDVAPCKHAHVFFRPAKADEAAVRSHVCCGGGWTSGCRICLLLRLVHRGDVLRRLEKVLFQSLRHMRLSDDNLNLKSPLTLRGCRIVKQMNT